MCPIPASEEFITDFGDSLFTSLNFLDALASLEFKLSVSQGCFSASASSGLLELLFLKPIHTSVVTQKTFYLSP